MTRTREENAYDLQREAKITEAVESMVDGWDLETLIDFAVQDRIDYFLGGNVDADEITQLLEGHSP